MPKATLLVGMGFGDEGKGTMVDFLSKTQKPSTVIRYNGGAQAAHNVQTDDNRHHTFAQFGSGSLHGVRTHLSRFMMVDLMNLKNEANHLKEVLKMDPYPLLTIDKRAPLITPYQRAVNRIKEYNRGDARHGSCGFGIGECMEDFLKFGEAVCPIVGDLEKPDVLYQKLKRNAEWQFKKFDEGVLRSKKDDTDEHLGQLALISSNPEFWVNRYLGMKEKLILVGDDYLPELVTTQDTIFEGAQGVLLDQDYGFHPHTTWSNTTLGNAYTLLKDLKEVETERLGVIRTHHTRHGNGPFPTWDKTQESMLIDWWNEHNSWQGGMRIGHFDLVLFNYALEVVGGIDSLALTHVDNQLYQVCDGYKLTEDIGRFCDDDGNIIKQDINNTFHFQNMEALGKALQTAEPRYRKVTAFDLLSEFKHFKIKYQSYGPRTSQKSVHL